MARTRSYLSPDQWGNGAWLSFDGVNFSLLGNEKSNLERGTMVDGVYQKPYPDSPMTMEKWHSSGALTTTQGPIFYLRDMPVGWDSYPGLLTPDQEHFQLKNRSLASSGPLTPKLYLPTAIFELKDLPDMVMQLKHAGDILHGLASPKSPLPLGHNRPLSPTKGAASANLAYQFGWAPLISDIWKLLNFWTYVDKRQKYLKKVQRSGGSKRRITLGSNKQTASGRFVVHSTFGVYIETDYVDVMSLDQWSTIRWTIREGTEIGPSATSFTESFKDVLGLQRGHIPISAWKALPWSWAVDWVINISQLLEIGYNSIYYKPSRLNIMTHARSERTLAAHPSGFPGLVNVHELKSRSVDASPDPSLEVRVPFVDTFKLSILGSLTIVKLNKIKLGR
ncbi:maturation protein [ssRNA phage Gerhypos.2_13]|uniref:Maturation protein n=2 Tax=Leviviricetes TaxID=2842243 RepID=A0A8S5KXT1_9VIRU|nr:maturation protein [ssRNA phage Gerhypos.2_13]QDH91027.1 MAG: hypothetical protein H2Bulk34399_000001 [Leviviridae sp.]DAD50072.1 TPA_asm: maturation protein [ssRNA phage Gerhypos.2_13]